ncbi:hypothetical protein [Glutamicibacter nicotianae]|uniref:hypothetical protein n=1 Tax=Glutamicibacter nicotianae TaxID=37929 RepID=UPI00255289BC|nr:hypothetical protein [Glutamicibacter nicotianae]WIV44535.1 hypothetical protein QQS42_02645 [Glutamicibacter nicotianae]
MNRLVQLIDSTGEALEGDLWDFYRLDLADVFRGSLSCRRVLMFVRRLMDEPWSRLRAELRGADWLGYTPEVHEMRDLYNMSGTHAQISANRKPNKKHFKQAPVVKQRASLSIADFPAARLAAQINN